MEPIVIKPRDPDQRNFLLELIRQLGMKVQPYPENLDEENLQALVEEAGLAEVEPQKVIPGIQDKNRIDSLISEIEKLDDQGRINVITRILALLKNDTKIAGESFRITRLRGLGKELWQKTNADAYVANERETWGS